MKSTTPKPFVFVLMPFAKEFNDMYNLAIRAACEEAGAYCERVDEQFYKATILQQIYNQINKADIIISIMTGRNPNVFYETGYAHALNKEVILVTDQSSEIPFDLIAYQHIIYDGSHTNLKQQLINKIRWLIANPSDSELEGWATDFPLDVYVDDILIKNHPCVSIHTTVAPPHVLGSKPKKFQVKFNLTFHNSTGSPYAMDLYIDLITQCKGVVEIGNQSRPIPGGRIIHNVPHRRKWLLPEQWYANGVSMIVDLAVFEPPGEAIIRVYLPDGPRDYSFEFTLLKP